VPKDDLLDLEQAQALLGVSRATLFNLMRRYKVPRYKIPTQGKRTYVKRADVVALQEPRLVERDQANLRAA
jgi:predicted DNA-binding transcriptional regulator AlpA